MKLHQTLAASAIALCAFGVGAANATVTWTSTGYTDAANLAGTTMIDDFDATSPAAGYSFSASDSIGLNDGSTGLYNASFGEAAMPPGASGNYFAVLGDNNTATLTSLNGPLTRISLLWGSIDTYNTIKFIGTTTSTTITGSQILATNLNYSGNQSAEQSNREVEFFVPKADGVTQIQFLSGTNSFEFDNITAGVPEPATWAMFLLGFGAIGWTLRGSRKASAATA